MNTATVQRAFLFTSVEGSTRLWDQFPEAMPHVIADYATCIRIAVEESGGRLFKTAGEECYADFSTASDASRAAIAAQRSIAGRDWRSAGLAAPIRVKMAIHSGEVREERGELAGQVLNRVSRLLAAGHGGQILIAGAAASEVEDTAGFSFRSLGERRLPDVPVPEHIFQVVIPGLTADFPPLRTLDPIPHNLPLAPNRCLGRGRELQDIRDWFERDSTRLVTLVGSGGIGKTRLAIQAAHHFLDERRDGVWFIDLSAVRDGAHIAGAVMRAVGIRDEPGAAADVSLLRWLEQRDLLLVLDNCEQILDGARHLVTQIMASAPHVRLIITSRIALHHTGEAQVIVTPLAVPEATRQPIPGAIESSPAVELFLERATAVLPSFTLNSGNAPDVAEICRRVDGIPLAIELAAARIASLDPANLREQLQSRLPALTGGARDLPDRHRTLQSAIAWSYDLLNDEEREVFQKLSAFAGGWTAEAAGIVANVQTRQLKSLVSSSLVRIVRRPDDNARFSMLETVREFAQMEADFHGMGSTTRDNLASWILELTEREGPYLLAGDRQAGTLRLLTDEYANIVAAMHHFSQLRCAEKILQIATAIWSYWSVCGPASEGQFWIEHALHMDGDIDAQTSVDALNRLGNITVELGHIDSALAYYRMSLRGAIRLRDRQMIARNACCLGMIANMTGGSEDEIRLLDRALRISTEVGDERCAALTTLNLAISHRDAGNFKRSEELHRAAISELGRLGDVTGVARAQNYLGLLYCDNGADRAALACFLEALEVSELHADHASMADAKYGLALSEIGLRRYDSARSHLDEAIAYNRMHERTESIADCLEALSLLHYETGKAEDADAAMRAAQEHWNQTRFARRRSHALRIHDMMEKIRSLPTV